MGDRYNLARYELSAPLFDGCFGTLWEAQLRGTPERRLVRVIEADKLGSEDRERALEAARAAIGVEHERVLPVTDAGLEDGVLFVASEYREGLTLRALLRALHDAASIELPVALCIARDLLRATLVAHELCRERDPRYGGLGPDSFFVCADGHTLAMELGLGGVLRRAKSFAQRPDRLGYDAPEMFQVGVHIDAAADVFSLGVMLWELMREERLLRGTLPQLVAQFRKGPLPRADAAARRDGITVPAALANATQRALELAAADRLPSPHDFDDALRAAAPASAKAVAEAIAGIIASEIERVRLSYARREQISAKTREASERPPASVAPPASASPSVRSSRPRRVRPPEVDVVATRMEAPTSLVPLWIALAVVLVGAVGYFATRARVAERAHYIMQVVRPPDVTALGSARPAASAQE